MSEARERLEAALARLPYARFLGVRGELKGDELTLILPYADHLIGNPVLPALHGGVVGALMELTALVQLSVTNQTARYAKTIDVNVDYLRSGKAADTFARARIVRIGRRIANVSAEAWQSERGQPIAAMRGHFLMPEDSAHAD